MLVSSEKLDRNLGLNMEFGYFPLTTLRYPLIGIVFYILTIALFNPDESKKDVIVDNNKDTQINNRSKNTIDNNNNNNNTNTKADNDIINDKNKNKKIKKNLTASDKLMFLHNIILCVFSLLCFINTAPVTKRLWDNGWENAVCSQWRVEYTKVYGFWTYLFYLSKFYEFIDTWIVMYKGRKPLFLQTFHHVGAVIGMWFCLATKSTGGYIFVVENTFIHTIMYFYYAISILGYKPSFKYIITMLQMTQFAVGNSIAVLQILVYRNCMAWEDKATIIYHVIYTTILFLLFQKFYKNSYGKK